MKNSIYGKQAENLLDRIYSDLSGFICKDEAGIFEIESTDIKDKNTTRVVNDYLLNAPALFDEKVNFLTVATFFDGSKETEAVFGFIDYKTLTTYVAVASSIDKKIVYSSESKNQSKAKEIKKDTFLRAYSRHLNAFNVFFDEALYAEKLEAEKAEKERAEKEKAEKAGEPEKPETVERVETVEPTETTETAGETGETGETEKPVIAVEMFEPKAGEAGERERAEKRAGERAKRAGKPETVKQAVKAGVKKPVTKAVEPETVETEKPAIIVKTVRGKDKAEKAERAGKPETEKPVKVVRGLNSKETDSFIKKLTKRVRGVNGYCLEYLRIVK